MSLRALDVSWSVTEVMEKIKVVNILIFFKNIFSLVSSIIFASQYKLMNHSLIVNAVNCFQPKPLT